MSLRAIQAAMRAAGLTAGQKVVLIGLADRVGDRLECWPKVATLAADVAMSRRTVQRHIQALEAAGLVTRLPGKSTRTGRQSANFYRLELWEVAEELRETAVARPKSRGVRIDTPADLRGDRTDAGGVSELTRRGDNPDAPSSKEVNRKVNRNQNHPPTTPPVESVSDGMGNGDCCTIQGGLIIWRSPAFERFKAGWMRHAPAMRWTSDLAAARAWNAAVMGGAKAAEIVAGVEWAKAVALPEAARYVPKVEKFLADALWTEQVPPAERGEGDAAVAGDGAA